MSIFKPKLNVLGLDVGDGSIETMLFQNGLHVRYYQRMELPEGVVIDGVIKQENLFIAALQRLTKDIQKKVGGLGKKMLPTTLSLPESKVFIYCFDVESQEGDDLKKTIAVEVKKIIPWNEAELYAGFASVKSNNTTHVVYVAAPKQLVDVYQKACAFTGFELVAVMPESLALGQALLPTSARTGAILILDIGARSTNASIFNEGNLLMLSITIPLAGNDFSKAVVRDKKLSVSEAEAFKKTGEIFFTHEGGSTYPALHQSVEKLTRGVEKALSYFEQKTKMSVDEVILAGGSALLNGFSDFIGEALDRPTTIGDPLKKVSNPAVFGDGAASILFADVIGQALAAEDGKTAKINLLQTKR